MDKDTGMSKIYETLNDLVNMEIIFALICLLSAPLYLGARHIIEYYDAPFSKENFGKASLLAAVLYFLYLATFLRLGTDGLYELKQFGNVVKKFSTFFIYPSIGFGLAIFPKLASEYIFNAYSMALLNFQYQLCSLIGWLHIIYLACVLLL
jgi:hypothetical protein